MVRISNSLDPYQAQRLVGPDLGPNCLPRLSADDTGRQSVKLLDITEYGIDGALARIQCSRMILYVF